MLDRGLHILSTKFWVCPCPPTSQSIEIDHLKVEFLLGVIHLSAQRMFHHSHCLYYAIKNPTYALIGLCAHDPSHNREAPSGAYLALAAFWIRTLCAEVIS